MIEQYELMEVDEPCSLGNGLNGRKLTRGEKSKIAAKSRRDKETIAFTDLVGELPICSDVLNKMDKASIVKLAVVYIKLKHFLQKDILNSHYKDIPKESRSRLHSLKSSSSPDDREAIEKELKNVEGQMMLDALNGFLIFITRKYNIRFISASVTDHLGLNVENLVGKNVHDIIHPCDLAELTKQFMPEGSQCCSTEQKAITDKSCKLSTEDKSQKVFYLRMKYNMCKAGSKTKQTGYTLVQWSGKLKQHISTKTGSLVTDGLVCICRPMQTSSVMEIRMDGNMFMSRHDLGMTFTFCDSRILTLIGYEPDELLGKTAYHFHNPIDAPKVSDCHQKLIIKGTSVSKYYRFLGKNDNWVWLQTRATIIYNTANKPQYIVCMNYVISEEEGERYLMLEEHKHANITNDNAVVTLPDNHPPTVIIHMEGKPTPGPTIVELEEGNLERTACLNGELDQPKSSQPPQSVEPPQEVAQGFFSMMECEKREVTGLFPCGDRLSNTVDTVCSEINQGSLPLQHNQGNLPFSHNQRSLPSPHYKGSLPSPHNQGSLPSPHNQGSLPSPHNQGSLPSPHNQGSLPSPHNQGSLPSPHNQGSLPSPHNQGSLPSPHYQGSLSSPHNQGSLPSPHNQRRLPLHQQGRLTAQHSHQSLPFGQSVTKPLGLNKVTNDATIPDQSLGSPYNGLSQNVNMLPRYETQPDSMITDASCLDKRLSKLFSESYSHSEDGGYESASSPASSNRSPQVVSPYTISDIASEREYTGMGLEQAGMVNGDSNPAIIKNCNFGVGYPLVESGFDEYKSSQLPEAENIIDELLQSFNQPTENLDENMSLVFSTIQSLTHQTVQTVTSTVKNPDRDHAEVQVLKCDEKLNDHSKSDKSVLRHILTIPEDKIPKQPVSCVQPPVDLNIGAVKVPSAHKEKKKCIKRTACRKPPADDRKAGEQLINMMIQKSLVQKPALAQAESQDIVGASENVDENEQLPDDISDFALQYLETQADDDSDISDIANDILMDTSEADLTKGLITGLEHHCFTGLNKSLSKVELMNRNGQSHYNCEQKRNFHKNYPGNTLNLSCNGNRATSSQDHGYVQKSIQPQRGSSNSLSCNTSVLYKESQTQTCKPHISELEKHLRNAVDQAASGDSKSPCGESSLLQKLLTGELSKDSYMQMELDRFPRRQCLKPN